MAIQKIARVKIRDGKKSGNNFRFMPARTGRSLDDTQTVFRSLPYLRVLGEPEHPILVGSVLGPSHVVERAGNIEAGEDAVMIDKFSKVVPLKQVSSVVDAVQIRSWITPEDMQKPEDQRLVKKYIDWASFQELAPDDVRLVKYLGNDTVNIEVWSGLFEPLQEEHFQLAQSLLHGSVAYSGGKNVAKAKKAIIDPSDTAANQTIARKMARLVGEKHGEIIAGNPIWSVKTWEIHFSPKDSEIVLVRNNNAYYVIQVVDGETVQITRYTAKDAEKWEKRFLAHLSADLAAQEAKAAIDAGIAAQASSAAA